MTQTTTVTILGREYQVACPQDKQHELFDAALLLDSKMLEIKNSGSVIGAEKIAIMAALNLANELLSVKSNKHDQAFNIQHKISMLCAKFEKVLEPA